MRSMSREPYFPAYYYETFRIIGFPAVVEKHVTCGVGYSFTEKFSMNLGYMHAFEKTISESGTDPLGSLLPWNPS